MEIVAFSTRMTVNALQRYTETTSFVTSIDDVTITNTEDADDVLLLFPEDKGAELESEYARRIGKNKVSIISAKEYDKMTDSNIDAIIKNRVPYPIDGVFYADSFRNEFNDIYDNGLSQGAVSLELPSVDKLISFLPGQLTVVTGVSGHGKSTFLDFLAVCLARHSNWKFAIFSPENTMTSFHTIRLAEQFTGKSYFEKDYNGNLHRCRMTVQERDDAYDWINKHFFFIKPDVTQYNLDVILEKCRYWVRKEGINSLIIDPFNRLDLQLRRGENETTAISRFLSKLQYAAGEFGIHNFLVAHPTKVPKTDDNLNDKVPTANDIAGSVHFKNVPDNIFVVYGKRDEYTKQIIENWICTQKIKHTYMGKYGEAKLDFDRETQRYFEFDEGK